MDPDTSGGIIFLLLVSLLRRLCFPKYNQYLSANLTLHNDYTSFHHCTPKTIIVFWSKMMECNGIIFQHLQVSNNYSNRSLFETLRFITMSGP